MKFLCDAVSMAEKIIDYLSDKRKDKIRQHAEKETRKAEKKIDEACDKGDIDDLFDAAEQLRKIRQKNKKLIKTSRRLILSRIGSCMTAKSILITIMMILATTCGCTVAQIEVPVVRPWEGRYESEKAAIDAVQAVKLEKGESVWLLSNSTLKRLLKTTKD